MRRIKEQKRDQRQPGTAANKQTTNQTIMKPLNQIWSGSITGLIGLVATSVMATDTAQYSSKAALLGSRSEPSSANVEISTLAQSAYAVSSKRWQWPRQPIMSVMAKSADSTTLLANDYNSKKAVRGEHESVQPLFKIAPLK